MIKNKKGNFADIVTTIEFSLGLGIVAIFVLLIVSNMNTSVQSMDSELVPNITKESLDEYNTALPSLIDILFLAVIVVFFAFSVIMARLIPSSPSFYLISFFALVLFVFAGIIIENIWSAFMDNMTITTTMSNLTFLPFILSNFIYFLLFYAVAVAIALLTKEN
jgi:hypothetical protein